MKLVLPIVFLYVINIAQATTGNICPVQPDSSVKRDSAVRIYFVCESHHYSRRTGIFQNGDVLTIWDTLGRQAHGAITILNLKQLEIESRKGKKDTFFIESVCKIKKSTIERKVMAGAALSIGWGGIAWGTVLILTPIQRDPTGLKTLGGALLLIVCTPIKIIGTRLVKGKQYKGKHYDFRVIQTKGFILKRKHIRYLPFDNLQ